jgi:hypothetical protein
MSRMNSPMAWLVPMLTVLVLATSNSCDPVTEDRQEGGTKPDSVQDTTRVTVWRNVDNAPNVITFCADGLAFAATSSVDGQRAPNLIRLPEMDGRCGQ